MKLKPFVSLILIWMMLLALLPSTRAHIMTGQDVDQTDASKGGLRFRLSEGAEKVEAPTPKATIAATTSLAEAETKKLLARLPTLNSDKSDAVSFKFRERSLPPPRTGETIQAAFALPTTNGPPSPTKTNAPLEVTRFAPEGEVELAPMLSVTFSQPMVAVSSQEEAAAIVPLTLTPQPKGKWRWLGTQTLIFQPETEGGRLPMATVYTVNIPAGTRSILGNPLPNTKTFKFSTPPPTLNNSSPSGESQPRDTLMVLGFDQRIDRARVLEHLKLQPASPGVRLRLATSEEIATYPTLQDFLKQAPEGRWLVVRAVGADGSTKDVLPSDTLVKVVVPAGTPSLEGPRTTVAEQSFTFKTYGPMRIVSSQCGHLKRCSPFDNIHVTFSNQLDTNAFQNAYVKITPEIPGVKITGYYNSLNIEGVKRANTTYTVTIDRALKDMFGQTLTGENQLTFKVTTAEPTLFSASNDWIVLDPAGPRAFTVYSINYARLRVALYKVTPEDWQQFRLYQGGGRNDGKPPPAPPGKLISDKIIDVNAATDQLIETAIDLSPALNDGYGQVFVKVEPVEPVGDQPVTVYSNRQNKAEAWVQSTEIGLDAFADYKELVVWANSLKDGTPLPGVELSVSPDDLTGMTGIDGLARLLFKASLKTKEAQPALIVARRGKDIAIFPKHYYPYRYGASYQGPWQHNYGQTYLSWYVFDDRKLYRPGEEVNIKGWVRKVTLTPVGDTDMFTVDPDEVLNYVVKDSRDNEITKGTVKLNALAGFNFKIQLPPTMNLGAATIELKFEEDNGEYRHQFQVQEFRRPEFEITTRISEAPHFVGSSATTTMTAAYYSGGGLANTEVEWSVTSTPTNYTPPNREGYTFGTFYPWWSGRSNAGQSSEQTFKGRTDARREAHAANRLRRRESTGSLKCRCSSASAGCKPPDARWIVHAVGSSG